MADARAGDRPLFFTLRLLGASRWIGCRDYPRRPFPDPVGEARASVPRGRRGGFLGHGLRRALRHRALGWAILLLRRSRVAAVRPVRRSLERHPLRKPPRHAERATGGLLRGRGPSGDAPGGTSGGP